jgi:hypothetical protein
MIASQIESPFADGYALLHQEPATEMYRSKEYSFTYHHYVCQVTGQSFTTDEADKLNVSQIYSQHLTRKKAGPSQGGAGLTGH